MDRMLMAAALMLVPTPIVAQSNVDQPPVATAKTQGVLRLKSANDFDTTVARIQADVAARGVMLFDVIDQQALAKQGKIELRRSTLILFGNASHGAQFLTANPVAGLDWPVRMLVSEDADGSVWISWNDFGWIAKRYSITNRATEFEIATMVSASIAKAGAAR